MVAILDITPPIANFKQASLRARLKMEERVLEQSLKESRTRDAELECMSDSCSDDSYSSSADYSCSSGSSPGYALTMSSLRSVTSAPSVSNSCIHVTTPKIAISQESPTRSKLTQLLHNHDSIASSTHTLARGSEPTATQAQASVKLFQIAWQMLPRNFTIRFALRDGATIDESKKGEEKTASVGEFLVKESQGKVLEAVSELDTDKAARVRECRMNKDFLRIYALDYSARITGTLPPSTEGCESTHSQLSEIVGLYSSDEDDEAEAAEYERQRISHLSQDKLWKCVILQPRADPTPCRTIDSSSYIRARDSWPYDSRSGRRQAPEKAMKPAGQLQRSRCLQSPDCPYSGCTVPQYTLRGWENRRWTSVH